MEEANNTDVMVGEVVPELTLEEKVDYIYDFAQKMTQVLEALGNNPMAAMILGDVGNS